MNNEHERQAGESEDQYRARVEAAHKAGKRIEWADPGEDWSAATKEVSFNAWDEGLRYRIAPGQQEPAKAREWWIIPGINHLLQDRFKSANGAAWCEAGDTRPSGMGWRELGVRVREVLPGDDVEALRAERLKFAEDSNLAWKQNAVLRDERDAAIEARDNALSAIRDMRAELVKLMGEKQTLEMMFADIVRGRPLPNDEETEDETGDDDWFSQTELDALNGQLDALKRIIALQDEIATVRNECAALSAKLAEATR